ncbi:MAG: O-antigen ligase family protein [Flavobacteriia bacterium]
MKQYFRNWTFADYSIASVLLVFAAYNKLMPVLMAPLFFSLVMKRRDWNEFKKLFQLTEPGFWFICFYTVHVFGLVNSENMNYALSDLGMKLSFLILPVLLFGADSKMTSKQVIDMMLFGLLIACFTAYSHAVYRSLYNAEDNHWAYFTGSYLPVMMHRSYFATYMAIGAILSASRFFQTKRWSYILLTSVFSITAVLTFSKAGILILIVTLFPAVLILTFRYYSRAIGLALTGLCIAGIFLIFNVSDTLSARFNKMLEGATNVSVKNNNTVESSEARMIMWATSIQLFSENPITGVGTGDVSDALDTRNKRLGNWGVAEKSYNSHNQFLNTGVQLGLLGLIPLILIFITSIWKGIRNNSFPFVMVTVILLLSLLFESFLETQQGIIPVTLFIIIFSLKPVDSQRLSA